MSNTKIPNKTSQQLYAMIQSQLNQQLAYQAKGDYVAAQNSRLTGQKLRKDYQARSLYQMNQRHRRQNDDLQKGHNDQLTQFNRFWDQKMDQFTKQGVRLEKQMMQRHDNQIQRLKDDLNKQLSLKVKESSQLLNLRKMEEHMAKQKNYVEAHRVQNKIHQLQAYQTSAWNESRDNKINTAVNTRKSLNYTQLTNLRKRIQTGLQQQAKDRHVQQTRINQKYQNNLNQMKSRHDKQVLGFKGQFKSKGGNNSGQSSPMQTKSKMSVR